MVIYKHLLLLVGRLEVFVSWLQCFPHIFTVF